MPDVEFEISRVQDPAVQDILQSIRDFLRDFPLFSGNWKFFELSFSQVEVNKKIPHNLGFQPKDIIQTSLTGLGDVEWNYDDFDSTNLDVTVNGACVVRAFIGRYEIGGKV